MISVTLVLVVFSSATHLVTCSAVLDATFSIRLKDTKHVLSFARKPLTRASRSIARVTRNALSFTTCSWLITICSLQDTTSPRKTATEAAHLPLAASAALLAFVAVASSCLISPDCFS